MAVSCFTRTIAREMDVVDFSWSTFRAGSCLLQRRRRPERDATSAFFTHENVGIIAMLFVAIFVFSNLIWLAEKDVNPDFRGDGTYLDAIWHTIWFTVVTFTTVGYGDKTTITDTGKTVALCWMFVGLGLYCLFTGSLAAALTNQAKVSGYYDLPALRSDPSIRVAALDGSATAQKLRDNGITIASALKSDTEGYEKLKRKEVDVMVGDWPIFVADMKRNRISNKDFVCYDKENSDSFGFAFPNNAVSHANLSLVLSKLNKGLIRWEKSAKAEDAFDAYFAIKGDDLEMDDEEPRWSSITIVALTLSVGLFGVWTLKGIRREYRHWKERRRRAAAGEEPEEEEEVRGGLAKSSDLMKLLEKMDSLENRLVKAKVIEPRKSGKQQWQLSRAKTMKLTPLASQLSSNQVAEANPSPRATVVPVNVVPGEENI